MYETARSFPSDAPTHAVLLAGLVAMTLRPPGLASSLLITGAVGIIGLSRLGSGRQSLVFDRRGLIRWGFVVGLGMAAFYATRTFGAPAPMIASGTVILANSVSAICEEAFFRRFFYSRLEFLGTGIQIVLPAVLFALVHVPAYGWAVLPIDLAAGLLLGWQRWAVGHWSAPAATHLFANLVSIV